MRPAALAVVAACLAGGATAQPLPDHPALARDAVRVLTEAAEAEAVANGWNVVVVVLDAGAHPLALVRMDGVILGSLEVAQRKARTAALYRVPTKVFADRLAAGDHAVLSFPDVIPLDGGLPVVVGGAVVGAIGVSGVRASEDAQIAQAGVDALRARLGE